MTFFGGSVGLDKLTTSKTHGIACGTCHRRRRRCDRALPSCHACANSGTYCEGYPLRWSSKEHEPAPPRIAIAKCPDNKPLRSDDIDLLEAAVDSAAAIALLTHSTRDYDIGPESYPDGLGHLVNYGQHSVRSSTSPERMLTG